MSPRPARRRLQRDPTQLLRRRRESADKSFIARSPVPVMRDMKGSAGVRKRLGAIVLHTWP